MGRLVGARAFVPGLLACAVLSAVLTSTELGTASAAGLTLVSQGVVATRTCTLTAATTSTTVVTDTEVRQGSPSTNYGSLTSLTVTSSGSANRRIYVWFDLSACSPAIPASALVQLATLRLYATALPSVCRTLELYRDTTAWVESTVTWNSQPFGTALNSPASSTRSAAFDIGTPVGCQNRVSGTYIVGAEPTTDVAAWVAGSASNFGWMIRDSVEASTTARTTTFSSKSLGTLAQEPQLVVTYTTS
jgi:hypothetical protein